MGKAAVATLEEILNELGLSIASLKEEGRLVQEAWGRRPDLLDLDAIEKCITSGGITRSAAPVVCQDNQAQEQLFLEAVKTGKHTEVRRLIEEGINVNYQHDGGRRYTRIGLRQEVGETALHWASLRGDDVIADMLLSASAEPDLCDQDGKGPLHIAAFNGVFNVTKRLLGGVAAVASRD